MSMGITAAFGEDAHSNVTVNVTVNGKTGHGYGYSQIFKGTQVVDGNEHNPLGDIQWGDDVSPFPQKQADIVKAVNEVLELTGTDALAGNSAAIAVAEKIATMSTEQATKLARLIYKVVRPGYGHGLHEGVNAVPIGYYLIYDQMDDGGAIGFSDAANAALLQMTKDITITTKTDAPVQEKKIKENTKYQNDDLVSTYLQNPDGDRTYGVGYNDIADYNIGDAVPFELLTRIPDMTYYDRYTFIFTDAMTPTLTLDESSIVVTIGDKTLTAGTDYIIHNTIPDYLTRSISGGQDVYNAAQINTMMRLYNGRFGTANGRNFAIEFQSQEDTDNLGLLYLVNKYKAEISGNENISLAEIAHYPIRVSFNATLNSEMDASGYRSGIGINGSVLVYSNKPERTGGLGTTVVDAVAVYTYELGIDKIDGAEVTLPETGVSYYDKDGNSATPEDAVRARYDGKNYEKINGKWIDTSTVLPGAQFTLQAITGEHAGKWVKVDANNKVSGWLDTEPGVSSADAATAKKSGVFITGNKDTYGNQITIIGLDDGQYLLHEIKAPSGYNVLQKPLKVTITGNTNNTQDLGVPTSWDRGSQSVKIETLNGDLYATGYSKVSIVNNAGAVLPSTGGIGTTIFYVVGSIMVVAAGVLLITKKRMGRE